MNSVENGFKIMFLSLIICAMGLITLLLSFGTEICFVKISIVEMVVGLFFLVVGLYNVMTGEWEDEI